jgi:hypothetical protein
MGEDEPARGSRIGTGEITLGARALGLAKADESRRRYLADGNPLHVWEAVMNLHAAYHGAPSLLLPAWVANYLAEVAVALARLEEASGMDAPKNREIVRALGLASPGRSAFRQRKADMRAASAAWRYRLARIREGRSARDASELVAGLLGCGASDVDDRARHVKRVRSRAKKIGLAGLRTAAEARASMAPYYAQAERIVAAINKEGDGTEE